MPGADLDELHAAACKVFTHATRIRLLNELRSGPRSVGDLADVLGLPQPNVSQHLAVMRGVGIVRQHRDGNVVRYAVTDARVHQAFDLMRDVLRDRLRRSGRLTVGVAA